MSWGGGGQYRFSARREATVTRTLKKKRRAQGPAKSNREVKMMNVSASLPSRTQIGGFFDHSRKNDVAMAQTRYVFHAWLVDARV